MEDDWEDDPGGEIRALSAAVNYDGSVIVMLDRAGRP